MTRRTITLPAGGEGVSVDTVSGSDFQEVKLVDGTENSTIRVPASTGPVAENAPALNVRSVPSTTVPQPVAAGDDAPIAVDVVSPGWDIDPADDYSLLGAAFDEQTGTRMSVGPTLAQAGQQPLALALPVALANEQFFDKWIQGYPCGPGGLGGNLLSPYPVTSPLNMALDVLQYRSVSFDLVTSAAISGGVVTFEGSNSGGNVAANWVAVAMTDLAAYTTIPVTSVTLAASTTRSFAGPILHRFFRLRISTAVAGSGGQVVAFGRLGIAPYAVDAPVVNLGQVAATNTVTGGVAGLMAVAGNIAPALAQTANPLVIGGVDFGALTRRIVTDVLGQLIITGPDFRNSLNPGVITALPTVRLSASDAGSENVGELLSKILLEVRRQTFIALESNKGCLIMDGCTDFLDDYTALA